MKRHSTFPHKALSLLLSFLFFCTLVTSAQTTMVQTARPSTYVNPYINGFYEALPSDYAANPTKKYPLLVFIHGIGEIGDGSPSQLPKVLVNGPPKLINNKTFPGTFTVNNQNFSFIVISPQFNSNNRTSTTVGSLIDYIVAHYRVDPSRIYLTGLSMGGGISWIYAGQTLDEAKRLAAVVPVSGNTSPYDVLVNNVANANLPVWAFHNQNDPTVPSSYTIQWIAKLNAHVPAPVPAARGTIFPVSGHDAWTKAYDPNYRENGKNVYEWMLQYTRGASANQSPVANAGADLPITLPTNSVTLSGSGTDGDGSISSYAWSQVSGPSTSTINSASSASTTVSNLSQGTYIFRLTVKDNGGLTATDDVTVTVNGSSSGSTGTVNIIPGKIEAESYYSMSGIQTENTADAGSGLDVGYIETGDWMDYNVNVGTAGSYTASFRVASPNTGGQLQLKKADGTVLATVSVPQTGGWQTWTTVNATVSLAAGQQTLRVYASSGGWNFNWLDFASTSTGTSKYVKVNIYGGSNAYSSSEWNNWNVGTGSGTNITSAALKYSDGSSSTINAVLSQSQAVGDNGSTYKGSMCPNEVIRYASYSSIKRTLTIKGLSTSKSYSIELYGSRSSNNYNNTIYSTGTLSSTISTYYNQTHKAGFQGVKPDASGQIVITIDRNSTYDYLNGFMITEEGTYSSTASVVSSETVQAASSATATKALTQQSVDVFPNPVTDKFILQVNNEYTGSMKVQILDMNGKVVKEMNAVKSVTGQTQTYLSLSGLAAGEYILMVQMDNWKQTKTISKL